MIRCAEEITLQQKTFDGLCSVCGHKGEFDRGDHKSLRESYPCPNCRFTVRWRDQAGIITDEFGRGQALSLDGLVSKGFLNTISIFEPALRGPFVTRFKGLPNYTQSYFRPDLPLGEVGEDGIRNEDLTKLSFDEDRFDLIITSDVMEHLPNIEAAFAETLRVLRPGGIHVFSIPNDYPFPDRMEPRVAIKNGQEINLKPPRYHNSGDGSKCLVYTDYGADISDLIHSLGGRLIVARRSGAHDPGYTNATFVMRKVASAGARRPGSPEAAAAARAPRIHSAPASSTATRGLQCPICDGTEFEDFNGRKNARCSTCRAVERNRMMALVLDRLGVFAEGKRVLHLAPEMGLAKKFVQLSGDKYHGTDIDTDRYKSSFTTIRKLDLCTDLGAIADDSYDLILHNHVLEHIHCDIGGVLREMDRILAPGGLHFFSVPIRGEKTVEDLSPDLNDTERMTRFGQEDHVRIFGSTDLQNLLRDIWGEGKHLIEPVELFSKDQLRRAVIPTEAWTGVTGHSLFHYRKGGRPPAEAAAAEFKAAPPADAVKKTAAEGVSDEARDMTKEGGSPVSKILLGIPFLRRDNPWPEFPWGEHKPFHLALDANGRGGREIIIRQIVERNVKLIVEVGCFLGGSSLHWLNAKADLTVIGVDPWGGNWAAYIEQMAVDPNMSRHVWHMTEEEVARIVTMLRRHGNFGVALNNLRLYKDRFIPVRQSSPEALYYLARRDIPVEMIYIDAFKHRDDLDAAYDLFPDAILCGDDWLWPDETGEFIMQRHITEFANEHGFQIEANRQSWVLHR